MAPAYVEIEKQAWWRGINHTWVNRYYLSTEPSGSAQTAVISSLVNIEEQLHWAEGPGGGVGFVESRLYAAGGGPPVFTIPYNESKDPGTATGFDGAAWSGSTQTKASTLEVCLLCVTPLAALSVTGKPVALRKYFRGSMYGFAEDQGDNGIPTADINGIKTLIAPWAGGLGGTFISVVGTSSNPVLGPPAPFPFMSNHQVPRGRKRKKTTLSSSSSESLLNFLLHAAAVGAGSTIIP